MSLYNTINTSISGMTAQANRLGTIGDNIANSSTTGYKRASAEFETLLGNEVTSNYVSGGVQTRIRYGVTEQGTLLTTASSTDLGISGNGFFVVQGRSGATAMTRAGSFVEDANGNLVNTAGYKLMGYSLTNGVASSSLGVIDIDGQGLKATASAKGTLDTNLPSTATVVSAANLPSANTASSTYTSKTSVTAYDNLGTPVTLDVYYTKTGANTWQATVYNHADAAANGSFPYSSGPLADQTLSFDATTGNLSSASARSLAVAIPNGNTVAIDLGNTTQLASDFAVNTVTMDGSAPSKLDHISIGSDGIVSSVYANGTTVATYQIAMANVESPDNLTTLDGDVYQVSTTSGPMVIGAAGTGNLGTIESSSLESSTVDIATELTLMISAQRGYEANSKVLQTSSDLLSIINNLKV